MKSKTSFSLINDMVRNKALYLMLLPGFVLIFIFSYMPMAGVLIAFKNLKFHGNIFKSFFMSEWVGLGKFRLLFSNADAFVATRNTLLYNIIFIIAGTTASVALSIALNEIRGKKLSKIYQTTFIFPHFLSWVIVAYFVYTLFSIEKGFVNTRILAPLGGEAVEWYFTPKYWPFILIAANLWKTVGFNAIVYLATISGIDQDYYEAAQIDGATKWQQIKSITIPMLMPIITILTILAVGRIFYADFGLFYNVPRDSALLRNATDVIDTYVYRTMRLSGDFGLSAAAGLYQATVGFVMILVTNAIVRKIQPESSLF